MKIERFFFLTVPVSLPVYLKTRFPCKFRSGYLRNINLKSLFFVLKRKEKKVQRTFCFLYITFPGSCKDQECFMCVGF